jgi:hypothetical protein
MGVTPSEWWGNLGQLEYGGQKGSMCCGGLGGQGDPIKSGSPCVRGGPLLGILLEGSLFLEGAF